RRFTQMAAPATPTPLLAAVLPAQAAATAPPSEGRPTQAATPRADSSAARAAAGPLEHYVAAADAARRVEPVAEGELAGVAWKTVRLVSQRWQGVEWTHELSLCLPMDVAAGGAGTTMLYWIDGGSAADPAAQGGAATPSNSLKTAAVVAKAARMPAAVIRQVPFQPMFGGLREDGLIAHTFTKFAGTGDATWPLLLPMVKAAVAGMDAAAEVAREAWKLDVSGFVVTGASKRGWTTWLSAAVEKRVVGIVPTVIDMLSLERHVRLQVESFGRLSEQLDDYTTRGIEKLLGTPRGRELIGIVDPYAYRDRLHTPKLITLGTNDPYWPLEALELYRGDLPGPCWVSYCPNAGHGIPGPRLMGLVAGMGRHAAGLEPLPAVAWEFVRSGRGTDCRLEAAGEPERVMLWRAASDSRDFRQARWEGEVVGGGGPRFEIPLPRADGRWSAAMIEVHHARAAGPLVLSTGVHVTGPATAG
ncbi:MAG: PhoPQ-activated protein PqaA family protein, partial [Planctomycetia bacterium]